MFIEFATRKRGIKLISDFFFFLFQRMNIFQCVYGQVILENDLILYKIQFFLFLS